MTEVIDNRRRRIDELKRIVRQLHEGKSKDEVREELLAAVRKCDAGEVAAMENELIEEEGVPVKDIMGMCDLHAEAVRDLLVEREHDEIKPGHPVDVFRSENEALRAVMTDFRSALERLSESKADAEANTQRARELFNQLMDVDKHYNRKENLLFPMLERYGITGPSKVMWGVDDEIRAHLKALGEAINKPDLSPADWQSIIETKAEPALAGMRGMFEKEERILLPMALDTLTAAEWAEIHEQTPEFGWCLIDPPDEYEPPKPERRPLKESVRRALDEAGIALDEIYEATEKRRADRQKQEAERRAAGESIPGLIMFPTGSLTFEQLKAIFDHLPVDLTFVDAEDRVRFFSEGKDRVFSRTKGAIGRKVQHCHPPSSVDVVERILDDFKSGAQDVAEFWLNFKGRFVHVRYFALRNARREYLGCLEVTQDLTRERALEGERRILQYE